MARHTSWTTRAEASGNQYDLWVDKLNQTFGAWNADIRVNSPFFADIETREMSDLTLVDCVCDPCGAVRSRSQTSSIPQEQLTIQLVLSGREYMELGSQEAVLEQGDIFVWDNTQPMRFSVLEPLHKLSLVMPLQRLKDWVPSDWRELPRHLQSGQPGTQILTSYLQSLASIDCRQNPMRYGALVEAAIALLVAPVPPRHGEGSQRAAQLELVKTKIRQRLRDPELDLETIARMNGISLRYLHWLFEATDQTPWRFVTEERLEACRRDLVNPGMAHKSVTEIAFSWGFSNAAHFGRRIKGHFGLTPSDIRAQAMRVN